MQDLPTLQAPPPEALEPEDLQRLSAEVSALAAERNAVILAHNYQVPEIQDVANLTGDSLQLSREAAATDADVIAFCGVHFMAETDYCCTSSNAVQVVDHIWHEHGPETEILFGPDMWLGSFVARELGLVSDPDRYARFHVWDGECHVHAGIRPDDIAEMRAEHPDAEFLIHPECGCSTQAMEYVASGDLDAEGVQMLSTSGMLRHVSDHPDGEFIVATETGMLYPLQQAAPGAHLIEANRMAFCRYMKMITLPKLRDSLRAMRFEVKVPHHIAERARVPIERMVSIS